MKPCSHVTCKTCTDTLIKPARQCVVCDKELAEKDIIELKREGMQLDITVKLLLTLRGFRYWLRGWRYGGNFEDWCSFSGVILL